MMITVSKNDRFKVGQVIWEVTYVYESKEPKVFYDIFSATGEFKGPAWLPLTDFLKEINER